MQEEAGTAKEKAAGGKNFFSSGNQLDEKLLGKTSPDQADLEPPRIPDEIEVHIVQPLQEKIIVEKGMEPPVFEKADRNIGKGLPHLVVLRIIRQRDPAVQTLAGVEAEDQAEILACRSFDEPIFRFAA